MVSHAFFFSLIPFKVHRLWLVPVVASLWIALCVAPKGAFASEGFSSTWRLLSPEAKEQFLAGYVQGWRDAAEVTDIVAEYVKENPQKAVDGLKKIRNLYDLSAFKASALSREVDAFYKDPRNAGASLSKAISFARNQLSP